MNSIFVYKGEFEHSDSGFGNIAKAASLYIRGKSFSASDIVRAEKGKPYINCESAPRFSLTHSGDVWICLFSESECGIDYQKYRECNYLKLAKRFFHPEESAYISKLSEEKGENEASTEFFRIWSRREAFGKMFGEGFFSEDMPSLIGDTGTYKGQAYFLMDLDLKKLEEFGIDYPASCSICASKNEELEINYYEYKS